MKEWGKILKNLTMFTQFGLSFITPLLLCLFLCHFISAKAGAGSWIYIPGFFFGLGGSFTFAWKFYNTVIEKEKKEKGPRDGVHFNHH